MTNGRPGQHIFIDLDGPILDTRQRHYSCYRTICDEHALQPLTLAAYWQQKCERIAGAELFRQSGAADESAALQTRWIERIEATELLALDRLQPDVRSILERWRTRGRRLSLITLRRSRAALDRQLARLAVAPLFDDIVVSDPELGFEGKAACALGLMAQPPRPTVWIGDTEVDARAADRAGCEATFLVTCGIRTAEYLRTLGLGTIVADLNEVDRLTAQLD